MKFSRAIQEVPARTDNGMLARSTTANACVDLFFKIGAARNMDIRPDFVAALVEDEDRAARILQWARDVRGGAGERKTFRTLIEYLANNKTALARRILHKIPIIGRWDDVLELLGTPLEKDAVSFIFEALSNGDGLCAKWMPRQGYVAAQLRKHGDMSPKQWRKLLVGLTDVVETKMCRKQWNDINFEHVPSLAHARYKKAFTRNSETYKAYVAKLASKEVKINAAAVFPHDVIKGVHSSTSEVTKAQWEALPNYLGDQKILAMVDVSGSMDCPAGNSNTSCMDVAVALGLYTADKLSGDFKDCFLTFTGNPKLLRLKGSIIDKLQQMRRAEWGLNTNLHSAFDLILNTGTSNNVADADMPDTLLILSDMQFDECARFDDTAFKMIQRKYEAAGYSMPNIVFWNLNARQNVPVSFNTAGVALVSGFSPAVLKAVLANKISTPVEVMDSAIMVERYAI